MLNLKKLMLFSEGLLDLINIKPRAYVHVNNE